MEFFLSQTELADQQIWVEPPPRVLTMDVGQHVGERVMLDGWLHQLRRMGGVNFLILRDRKGLLQIVVNDVSSLQHMLPESVLQVSGLVVAESRAQGGYELHDANIEVISPVTEALPYSIHHPDVNVHLDTYLDHPIVGLRHPRQRATLRLSAGLMAGFRTTLNELDFTEIQSPKLVGTATESGANVFEVDYFGRRAYLAQSPQFYKQMMTTVFERVYEVGPVFRAEPHDTTRHVNEYVSLDVEMAFIQDHRDVMAVVEKVISGMIGYVSSHYAKELELLQASLPVLHSPFPAISFLDAQRLIFERWGEDCQGEPDLAPQHERWLGQWASETYHNDFLFVTGYPMEKRPFYTHPQPSDPRYSNSFDLLFRGTELITGGQRLHRYQDYLTAAQARGIQPQTISGYLEAFRYGAAPHGGFAIGLERFIMQLLGLSNIREASLFPRDLTRITP
jgi:nondiscriminating aspartyl-tRNA synthetase